MPLTGYLMRALGLFLALALFLSACPAEARAPDVIIPLGQTTIFTVPLGVTRVAIGDGTIAAVSLIQDGTGRTLLIEARKPGLTNFLVWQSTGPVQNYFLEVLSSRRPESVAIRIRVIEVKTGNNGNFGIKWSENLRFKEAPPNQAFRFGLPIRDSLLEARVDMLLQDKSARLLAQPTLVTMNGRQAKFLAGGELPIPIQTPNSFGVEWRPFGVSLTVTPSIEGVDDLILNIKPEVSSIDPLVSIKAANVDIPVVLTRSAESTVSLKSGESIVIAGLIKEERSKVESKLPLLGHIPILGALFTATEYRSDATELVFIVSPTIIQNNEVRPESEYGKALGAPGAEQESPPGKQQ